MFKFILNICLIIILIFMLFSLYNVLNGRKASEESVNKLMGLIQTEKDLSDKLSKQNKYYSSNEYVERVSRDNLDLASKGEYVVILPKDQYGNNGKINSSKLNNKVQEQSNIMKWVHILLN